MKVEKRDGTIQEFRFEKIKRVIEKVFSDKQVNEEVPEKFIEQVKQYFDNFVEKHEEDFVLPIEDIQDVIRDFLIKKNKIKAAEAFILYRKKREEIREEIEVFQKGQIATLEIPNRGMTFISKDLAAEIHATKLQYSNEFHDDNDIDEDSIEIPRRMMYNCNR